jgi:hypothetical protein
MKTLYFQILVGIDEITIVHFEELVLESKHMILHKYKTCIIKAIVSYAIILNTVGQY